jgi:hypothetical protein
MARFAALGTCTAAVFRGPPEGVCHDVSASPPTRFRCPDSAREIIARHVCLSSFSKNVDGELRLLHEEEERCAPSRARSSARAR